MNKPAGGVPTCVDCGGTAGPMLVQDGRWVCGPCLYIREHPHATIVRRVRRRVRLQVERLFDV